MYLTIHRSVRTSYRMGVLSRLGETNVSFKSIDEKLADHVFQALYCHDKSVILKEGALYSVEDDKKLLVMELEHFQCPHGVSLIETERSDSAQLDILIIFSSLTIQKAAVLTDNCYFIGEDNHLYQFSLTKIRDRDTYKAEKVLKLRNRKIRDVRAGK